MTRSKVADRQELSQTSILELAKDVRKAQALREAELEQARRSYEKALAGSMRHAGEFLQMVQKGDTVYDRAMKRALERYRAARSGEAR
jgi:hypothetical protein